MVEAVDHHDEFGAVVPEERYHPDANLQRQLDSDTPDGLGPGQHNESKGTLPHLCPIPKDLPINPNPITETFDVSSTIDEVSAYNGKDFDSGIFTWSEGASNSRRLDLQGDVPNIGSFACPFYKMNPNKYFPTTRRYRTCPTGFTELRRIKFVPYTV